ncbi:MAG: sulfotransferase domain-containing protein [Nitrospirae bacterium]|nr:sulfotransferase domain-containing protein [Nitrospirota bacterium]
MGPKIVVVGVGNSGTKILGILINELLARIGYTNYHYEPLYWSGTTGEAGIVPNPAGVEEHKRFPLIADSSITEWPWMDDFIGNLSGLAKFIRAGSRIRFIERHPVKIIWITRELYSYLASMEKNFPRCLPDAGWHHRPGKYDDFKRIQELYPDAGLRPEEEFRVEVEAAWWHLHNIACLKAMDASQKIMHLRFETLCREPARCMKQIAEFIQVPYAETKSLSGVHPAPERNVSLSSRNIRIIEEMSGELNRALYPRDFLVR